MNKTVGILISALCIIGIFSSDVHAIKVVVTEKIPGAKCTYQNSSGSVSSMTEEECKGAGKGACRIVCEAESGFGAILGILGGLIKYFTYLAGLGGVLFLVINGIMYSMGGADEGMKSKAKENVVKTLVGLIVLLMSGVILNIIAPWVYV